MENLLEVEIINMQSAKIGNLTTENIELRIRLAQALQTADALAKELEAINDGNAKTDEHVETSESNSE